MNASRILLWLWVTLLEIDGRLGRTTNGLLKLVLKRSFSPIPFLFILFPFILFFFYYSSFYLSLPTYGLSIVQSKEELAVACTANRGPCFGFRSKNDLLAPPFIPLFYCPMMLKWWRNWKYSRLLEMNKVFHTRMTNSVNVSHSGRVIDFHEKPRPHFVTLLETSTGTILIVPENLLRDSERRNRSELAERRLWILRVFDKLRISLVIKEMYSNGSIWQSSGTSILDHISKACNI